MTSSGVDTRLLSVDGLSSGYGQAPAIREVSLHVDTGEMVAVIGPNGAGKSTLLKAIAGLLPVFDGTVNYRNESLDRVRAEARVRAGIALVPEGRRLFGELTVAENLRLGAYTVGGFARASGRDVLARVHELFPVLEARGTQIASTLSGGEQQMLAIGRALMSSPSLLLLDEPSLGLAPRVVGQILSTLESLRETGTSILIVEQEALRTLKLADRGYVITSGRIRLEGDAATLLANEDISEIYLGANAPTRRAHGEGEPHDHLES